MADPSNAPNEATRTQPRRSDTVAAASPVKGDGVGVFGIVPPTDVLEVIGIVPLTDVLDTFPIPPTGAQSS